MDCIFLHTSEIIDSSAVRITYLETNIGLMHAKNELGDQGNFNSTVGFYPKMSRTDTEKTHEEEEKGKAPSIARNWKTIPMDITKPTSHQ